MKKQIIVFGVAVLLLQFLFTGCSEKDEMSFEISDISETTMTDAVHSQEVLMIYVDVCGAVQNPGVYSLKEDARVFEAIDAAGGFLEEAYVESVNRAERVTDGQKIYIMNQTEWEEAKESGAIIPDSELVTAADGKININTASESELCTLPGIGAARANAIIAYREASGGFTTVEEIQKVSGIKNGTYEKICDLIKVR